VNDDACTGKPSPWTVPVSLTSPLADNLNHALSS